MYISSGKFYAAFTTSKNSREKRNIIYSKRRELMPNFSTKTIITASGALLLLIAGAVTMFLTQSREDLIVSSSSGLTAQNSHTQNQVTASSQNSQPQTQADDSTPQSLSSNQDTSLTAQNSPVKIWYVYVTGAVKSPGVYKLSEDSRIFHAIDAAGGFTSRADDTSLNLAEPLADGVHVHVATKGERNRAQQQQNNSVRIPGVQQNNFVVAPNSGNGNLVDINNASENELQRLSGIGPALAKRIIDYRQTHGNFTRPEDLLRVSGIGQAKLNNIRAQIQVGNYSQPSQNSSIISPRSQSTGNLIDINHASESELQRLNGIGPSLAKRIIQYRQAHGNFTRPEDLLKVSGIGQAKLKNMRSQIQIR